MMKIQVLSLIAALSFGSIAFSQVQENNAESKAVVDVTPAVASCLSDTKGVPNIAIEANTTIMETLKPVGGLKGLFNDWETDGGSVKFFPSAANRFRLEYSFLLNTSIAVITKICKVETNLLKLSGHVSGDPFVMYIRITSDRRLIRMSLEGNKNGDWYNFRR